MDEIEEAMEKYKGLVPLVYDIERQELDEAKTDEYKYAVYLKTEADKVIAHQKYKRCELMAMWCWAIRELNRFGDQDYMNFAEKWRKRWLKLAEHFKEDR